MLVTAPICTLYMPLILQYNEQFNRIFHFKYINYTYYVASI